MIDFSIVIRNNERFLKITDTLPVGSDSNREDSALVRPFKKLIESATPGKVGSVNYIILRENGNEYVLGSLVYTEGNRILFFPGLTSCYVSEFAGKKLEKDEINLLKIDHITLEDNLEKIHFKMFNGKIPSSRVKKINDHIKFWFQYQLGSVTELESCPKDIEFYLKPSPIKKGRDFLFKLPQITKSIDRGLSILSSSDKIKNNFFWAFQFCVVHPNVKTLLNLKRIQINYPPHVIVNDNRNSKNPIDTAQIFLKGFDGYIVIKVFKIIGKMQGGLFSSGISLGEFL